MNEDGVNFSASLEADGETRGSFGRPGAIFRKKSAPFNVRVQRLIGWSAAPPPREILYIERIATHPRNGGARRNFETQYKLIGAQLMRWAVELAFELDPRWTCRPARFARCLFLV